jgi:IS6 family transposase
VQRYAPEIEKRVRPYQGQRSGSWRVDETYVRVGGKWKYLFRAVDKHGQLIDFMLSDRRNTKAALSLPAQSPEDDERSSAILNYD